MKKILLAISMMFALSACIYEDMPQTNVDNNGDVVVDFSIVIPEAQAATKSLDAPAVTSLTVVVFDENGFFVAAREATQIGGVAWTSAEVSNVDSNQPVGFQIALPQSSSPRKLHFVANMRAEDFEYGMETDVMTSLVTSNRNDAYWQTIEVQNLLAQDVEALSEALTKIPMVRNYAKIVVNNTAANFTYQGFRVINAPTSGTVVPYNVVSEGFQLYWKDTSGTKAGRDYSELSADSYHGFMPYGWNENTGVADLPAGDWTTAPVYTYERIYDQNASKPLSILVKGIFNDDDDQVSYYKVDIYDFANGNYDVLRNIQYTVNITEVLGDGYGSADDAAANTAGNNISESTSTSSLLNISDGNCRLFVEYVAKRVLTADEFYLKYKFVPDVVDAPSVYNNSIANTYGNTASPSNTNPITITCSEPKDSEGPVISGWEYDSAYGVDSEGWSRIKLTPVAGYAGQNWTEDLVITSTYDVSENQTVQLSRTVSLYRLDYYTLSASCTPSVPDVMSSPVTVNTELPVNLPSDIFPLVFKIEAGNLSLYPETGRVNVLGEVITMPVVSGASINPDKSGVSFHFERTLTWAEYEALNATATDKVSVPTYFLTNKENSATTVYVYNQYFNLATCSFTNTVTPDVIIHAGSITFDLHNSTAQDIYVYKNSNYSGTITTLENVSDGDTNSDINLGKVQDSQTIYFRYEVTTTSGGYWGSTTTTYYTAQATVAQLKSGTTLTFTAE